jgi:dGTPase
MVMDLVTTTREDYSHVRMSERCHEPFLELRAFMFQRVYYGSSAKVEEAKVQGIIEGLYRFYCATQEPRRVVDFIAGMTDRYAIQDYERIFLPRPWRLRDEGPR